MKIVFAARAGRAAEYIARQISKEFEIKVLFETGKTARRKKLKRYFKLKEFYLWPLRVIDVLAIIIYNKKIENAVVGIELDEGLTNPINFCDDINDSTARAKFLEWQPDLVLIYGTGILNSETLGLAPLFLNLHGGIVPQYRNVHSEFWALSKGDIANVGCTVLYVDLEIDSGEIAFQERLMLTEACTVREAILGNIKLAAELAVKTVRAYQSSGLPRVPQNQGEAIRYPTPTFRNLLSAVVKRKPKL